MSDKHELENLMRSTMENLRDMIDVNTVVGDVLETSDGTSIVPISKVSFGFASGGSEFGEHVAVRNGDEISNISIIRFTFFWISATLSQFFSFRVFVHSTKSSGHMLVNPPMHPHPPDNTLWTKNSSNPL